MTVFGIARSRWCDGVYAHCMRWWGLVVVVLILCAGCASRAEPAAHRFQSPGADVTATDSDNAGHVQLRVGQILDIVLADDYETTHCQWHDQQGYKWEVLEPLGQQYEPHKKPPEGSGDGTFTSRYRATGAGTVQVRLSEEDNANPPRIARQFSIVVDVTTDSINS